MSYVYSQAAKIIQQFWDKKASLKTLVYESSSPNKVLIIVLFFDVIGLFARNMQ